MGTLWKSNECPCLSLQWACRNRWVKHPTGLCYATCMIRTISSCLFPQYTLHPTGVYCMLLLRIFKIYCFSFILTLPFSPIWGTVAIADLYVTARSTLKYEALFIGSPWGDAAISHKSSSDIRVENSNQHDDQNAVSVDYTKKIYIYFHISQNVASLPCGFSSCPTDVKS